jgi:hypothetical protein
MSPFEFIKYPSYIHTTTIKQINELIKGLKFDSKDLNAMRISYGIDERIDGSRIVYFDIAIVEDIPYPRYKERIFSIRSNNIQPDEQTAKKWTILKPLNFPNETLTPTGFTSKKIFPFDSPTEAFDFLVNYIKSSDLKYEFILWVKKRVYKKYINFVMKEKVE